jgi:hypothetical protein
MFFCRSFASRGLTPPGRGKGSALTDVPEPSLHPMLYRSARVHVAGTFGASSGKRPKEDLRQKGSGDKLHGCHFLSSLGSTDRQFRRYLTGSIECRLNIGLAPFFVEPDHCARH